MLINMQQAIFTSARISDFPGKDLKIDLEKKGEGLQRNIKKAEGKGEEQWREG